MSIIFDIDDPALKVKLATLPEKMADYAFEVLIQQAELMKGLWQIYINVDTGSARDSIRIERGGKGQAWRQVSVRGGGYVVNPKTGRRVDYMPIIEAKYGAGYRAFNEVTPTIAEMIKANVVQKVTQ